MYINVNRQEKIDETEASGQKIIGHTAEEKVLWSLLEH